MGEKYCMSMKFECDGEKRERKRDRAEDGEIRPREKLSLFDVRISRNKTRFLIFRFIILCGLGVFGPRAPSNNADLNMFPERKLNN